VDFSGEGPNIRRFSALKYSRNSQRKQTTQNRDYLADVEVQLRDRQGVPSGSLAFSKRESENRADGNTSNLMEKILARDNMIKAYQRVKANKGSHGIDGMSVDELRDFLIEHWLNIKQKLLEGNYYPSPVRRVEIPKPDGGVRKLGIPTVLDRLIQQAIAQELTKKSMTPPFQITAMDSGPTKALTTQYRKPNNT
jgi:RNA-directed DNA polymerase